MGHSTKQKTAIVEFDLAELERLQSAISARMLKEITKGRFGGLSIHNPWRRLSAKIEAEISELKGS